MVLDFCFYTLGAALLGLAVTTVIARNLFRAALSLLGVLLCTAILFLFLRAEMVALVQVMVYIGGIMIFVLYAVLLTSELGGRMAAPSPRKIALSVMASALALGTLGALATRMARHGFVMDGVGGAATPMLEIASLKLLGLRLLDPGPNGFLIPFELVSVILLAAMVGAIAIARESKGKPS
jgi:NADH-quinone oxidoreductase subunit J